MLTHSEIKNYIQKKIWDGIVYKYATKDDIVKFLDTYEDSSNYEELSDYEKLDYRLFRTLIEDHFDIYDEQMHFDYVYTECFLEDYGWEIYAKQYIKSAA